MNEQPANFMQGLSASGEIVGCRGRGRGAQAQEIIDDFLTQDNGY